MTRRPGALPWVFVVALMLAAYNFRAPFVAVAPVAALMRRDLGVSAATVGLLTSLPVLCFGLAAPLALLVVRRLGAELALSTCLGAIAVGAVVRSSGGFATVALGTLVIGLAITIGNIVVPVLIRRDVPVAQAGLVTGVYVAVMNVGSMVVSLATEPLSDVVGWRGALLAWGLLALVGLLAWMVFLRFGAPSRSSTDEPAPPTGSGSRREAGSDGGYSVPIWRRPVAWLLAAAFAGQGTSYYGVTAWLPSVLHDRIGLGSGAAGAASSVFQVCAIGGAVTVPALAKVLPAWVPVLVVGVLWMSFPVQLLVAPHLFLLGSVLGGVAQGGGLAALFSGIVAAARTDAESARMSAFVQGAGYVVAAAGPSAMGLAHDLTDAWTLPVLIILGSTATFTVMGSTGTLRASRVRHT